MAIFTETRFNILKFAAMKKLILFLGAALLCVSCDPPLNYNKAHWFVKNNTEQTLKIDNPFRSTVRSIVPGDSIEIYGTNFPPSKIVSFDYFGQRMIEECGEDVAFNVVSEEDGLLKQYRYVDRDLVGKQFFKESSWFHYKINVSSQEVDKKYIWVFEILPEDIQ